MSSCFPGAKTLVGMADKEGEGMEEGKGRERRRGKKDGGRLLNRKLSDGEGSQIATY